LTLDDAELGVIATVKPETFAVKLLAEVLRVIASVLVVDTTCKTLPAGKSARVIAGDTGPHTVVYNSNESESSKYVTIPSDGEPKAAVLAAASANTITA